MTVTSRDQNDAAYDNATTKQPKQMMMTMPGLSLRHPRRGTVGKCALIGTSSRRRDTRHQQR